MKAESVARQLLCVVLSCVIVFQPGFVAMAGDRPLVVDPAAPAGKRPTMGQAGNGVPIEQIATPGRGGVSHNMFSEFNVNKPGLIINNSKSLAKSQLGGFISGNPNLKGGTARLILNEVTGANRSYLEGPTELHGAKADYILANPNGITVNGGSFIHFPKVTLTTGAPRLGAGGLTGIDVRSGDILIEGDGLDASDVDAFTLFTRATRINADIHAQALNIIAGRNSYNSLDGSVTPLASNGSDVPSVAIDSRALGGMYAGRILLQGTETGVGVNLEGVVQSVDSFELTADGQIRLKNEVKAGGDINIASGGGSVAIGNTVYAGGSAAVSAADALDIHSKPSGDAVMVASAGDLSLSATTVGIKDGEVTAGLQTDGSVSGGVLSMIGDDRLSVKDSHLVSGGSLSIASPDISINGGSLAASDTIAIQGTDSGDVTLTGAAEVASLNVLDIKAGFLGASDGLLKANDLSISLTGDLDLGGGTLKSTGVLMVEADSLTAGAGASVTSFANMVLTLDILQNDGGLIYAGDLLDMNVRELNNTAEGYIVGVNGLDIAGRAPGTRAERIHNDQAAIESTAGSVHLAADSVENISGAGTTTTEDGGWIYWNLGFRTDLPGFNEDGSRNVFSEPHARLRQNKGGVNNHLQYILEEYGLAWHRPHDGRSLQEWIHTTKEVIVEEGVTAEILSAGDMTIDAGSVLNDRGHISAGGDLTINAETLDNHGVELSNHLDFYRNYHQVRAGGKYSYGQVQQHFKLSQVVDSDPAVVAAAGTLTINVPGHVDNESFKEGEQYTGKFAGDAAYSDLEVTGPMTDPNTGEPVNTVSVSLPTGVGSLYVVNEDPEPTYLIETNPVLADPGVYYGSQYFFDEVGDDVVKLDKQIMGDPFFETNMVRKQILEATGERYLSPTYTSDADQFRQLMDNAAQAKKDLGLEVGVALTADQLAGLTEDIVWYETREFMGKEALVPVVYLSSATQDKLDLTRGAMLTGSTVNIQTADLKNSGGIRGGNVSIEADNVRNEGGDLIGQTLDVTASNDIVNESGSIKGGDITLTAGHDVVVETKTEQRNDLKDSRGYVNQTADVTASGDLTIVSGRDTSVRAGNLSADGTLDIDAAGDVTIGTKTVKEHIEAKYYKADQTGHMGSHVQAGDLHIASGGDVTIAGSSLSAANDAAVNAAGDVMITGVTNTFRSEHKRSSSGGMFGGGSSGSLRTEKDRVTQSSITAGGDVAINAGTDTTDNNVGNLVLQGSRVQAGGSADLAAEGDIVAGAMEDRTYEHKSSSSSGMFSSSKSMETTEEKTVVMSSIQAGQDARLTGGGSVALQATKVKAGRDVELTAETGGMSISSGQETKYHHAEASKSGFLGTGSIKLEEQNSVTTVRSEIEGGGKVALKAEGDITLQAASIKSGDETEITSTDGQVAMLVAKDSEYEHKVKSDSGFFLWSSKDKGKIDETVLHTLIDAGGGLTVTTPEGVVVELKESTGDVRQDAELLSSVEGLEWMGDLLERDDVDWQAVQEVHDKWSKSDSGLGVGGMLIVAIIASAATAGAASHLAAMLTGLEVGAEGAIITAGAISTQLAMQAALTAAFTSISSQVAVALADAAAGGDLGDNLSGIISVDGLRALVATMITAGTLSTYGSDFAKMGAPGEIMAKTTVKTLTNTIVGGEDLEESFQAALGSTFASYAKGEITSNQLNDTVNLILSGATGAAGSAIAGGDPVQGALSAIVAELAEQIKAPELSEERKAKDGPKAVLSKVVYGDDGEEKLPEGYEKITAEQFVAKGVDPSIMVDEKSGFYSELFYNKENKEYVVVYCGTDMTQGNDLESNVAQATGNVGAQYAIVKEQVTELRKMVDLVGGETLTATGHSLGGGLALAAAATGKIDSAVAFNPAGLHPKTVEVMKGEKESVADATTRVNRITTTYVSRGDVLNNLQDLLDFAMPTAMGDRYVVEGAGAHGIGAIVEAFGQQ
ncbi:hemagglutinin repeat-containing protein [Desulfovibrio sp. Huiquan2017]|uniref:two-partner secretion domain-containing protein n=1 Tax=Desulfovibrio sp. Huiquan2017 TaxID=2816861 RepID=UPI001A90E656|nr:hemagglutinin repeat-containing protein [Desulfovibrio sp. Huiquan2017]